MTPLIRSASLTQFPEIAQSCGLDPRALLTEFQLPLRCLDEPDLMIPAAAFGRLLEAASVRGREPAFGLRMAESRRLSNLGPLALLVRDEPTLRDALRVLVAHIHLHNEALSVNIEQVGNLVSIRETLEAERAPTRQGIELAVAVTFRILSIFMGAAWRPRLVCFTHAPPTSLAVHRRVFGHAVEFRHEFSGIVCNAGDLDAANPGADPVLARYTRRLVVKTPVRKRLVTDRVREFVALLLPRGHCRVKTVAQHLGVDRRTIARHLAEEGTTFTAIVDGVRGELLARYLDDGGRPLTEVASLLGFSEASAFSRWHRGHFGVAARSRLTPRSRLLN